ncbi:MAG: site-2 protease family protein [Phycisphaerales bacterium]|nr:site-2 protease family protein [Phycisphaerales bacterium]
MTTWWVTDILGDDPSGYIRLLSWIFWVIFSICLHELAHGWAAIEQGDDTPRTTGHMTLNPLVHMGRMSLLMFALIGIAWGAMPVNPSRFRDGLLGDAKVSAAGPAMNLLLAVIALTILGALEAMAAGPGASEGVKAFAEQLTPFLLIGGILNIALMALNLLPIPPLDGSTILRSLVPATERIYSHQNVDRFALLALLAVFFFGGRYLFSFAASAAYWWTGLIGNLLT